jgi:hypothetical protein
MIVSTKAVAALALATLGGTAGTTAAYVETHPRAFTLPSPTAGAAPAPLSPYLPVAPATAPSHRSHVVDLDITYIAAIAPLQSSKWATARPSAPACSGWQNLGSGPVGRHVRMLCY